MRKPAEPANDRLSALQRNPQLCSKTLIYPTDQAPDSQKVSRSYRCALFGKAITNNIDFPRARFQLHLPGGVRREQITDLADFPAVLDLQIKLAGCVVDDLPHCTPQIVDGVTHKQQIIHITDIVLHRPDPFPSPRLRQLACNIPVQWSQVIVGEPGAGIVTDGKPFRRKLVAI